MTDVFFGSYLAQKLDELIDGFECQNFMDYPESKRDQWTKSKISLYSKNIVRMFYDNYDDYLTSFIGMVKSGEVYSYEENGKAYVDRNGYL